MQFALTEEQELIRDTARGFFNEQAASERLRAVLQTGAGYDPALWHAMAREMGWAGIAIPEVYGGSGLGMVELCILQHEQGRRLVPSPFFSTVCLAAPLIKTLARETQKAEWLGRIARGEARVAVALTGERGIPGCDGISAQLSSSAGRYELNGESSFVIHARTSDLILVAARAPGSAGKDGVSVVCVDACSLGVRMENPTMLDLTRPMSRLKFDQVEIPRDAVLGEPETGAVALEYAMHLACIALAAEAVGGAEWTLEMTCAYARQRVQFGRPIGSFQVVKHRLADMMVLLEAARSAAGYAACVVDELEGEIAEASAIAKASCCDAFYHCAADAIQLHGGIGFTWEHDAHLYFKRARAMSSLLGSPVWQRERLASLMGLGAVCEAADFSEDR